MTTRFMILLTALLIWAVPSTAHASAKGYYYNATSLEEIASGIDVAVKKDPTGHSLIAPEKCRKDGSCGTPAAYLASIQAHDPEAGLTSVTQVASFMRERLVKDCTVSGAFQMDSITLTRGVAKANIDGMSRSLRKGECVYIDKLTHRVVLAEHCANPVGRRVMKALAVNPCQYVDFTSADETGMVVEVRDPNDRCLAMRDTSTFSVADNGQGWKALPSGCIVGNCIVIPIGAGKHQVRFSPGNEPGICLDFNGEKSFKNQVRPEDMSTIAGERHARIYRQSHDVPKGIRWGMPKGLGFWASTQTEADAMNASFQR